MWIRAYSPRAGWQEALAQPKNITSSPQAFLVTPGTAAGLTVLLVWCCKFYTNHHTALISMWVCIWYSQAEAALQVLVQATLLPKIQHITDQQDLQKDQKDVNFSWLSCECQNVRNRLVALGMIWHPLAASLPANGSWSLILVRGMLFCLWPTPALFAWACSTQTLQVHRVFPSMLQCLNHCMPVALFLEHLQYGTHLALPPKSGHV